MSPVDIDLLGHRILLLNQHHPKILQSHSQKESKRRVGWFRQRNRESRNSEIESAMALRLAAERKVCRLGKLSEYEMAWKKVNPKEYLLAIVMG